MTSRGLAGYRRLLRSAGRVFKGDTFALAQARLSLREEFKKNSGVSDADALKELYQGIDEVDEMLRFNIVQGKLNKDKATFEVKLSSEEHKVTIEEAQKDPHGPTIERIDKVREIQMRPGGAVHFLTLLLHKHHTHTHTRTHTHHTSHITHNHRALLVTRMR